MRVAVAGGTGVVGRYVVAALQRAGHEAVVLSRSRGCDVFTGDGLDAALAGVAAVVDVSNVETMSRRRAVEFFTTASRSLQASAHTAGVGHLVTLSIVGVDRVDLGYYDAKRRQEDVVLAGPVPATVLRATQFHEFARQLLGRVPGPVAVVPRMRVQPVAAEEVGTALAELAAGPPLGHAPELAGPEEHDLGDLVRRVARRTAPRRRVVSLTLPVRGGRAMASGALLPTGPGPRGVQTFETWLARQR